MKARIPALPVDHEDGVPIRHWAAAMLLASALSWAAVVGLARLIAGLV